MQKMVRLEWFSNPGKEEGMSQIIEFLEIIHISFRKRTLYALETA